ncbi:MAG TPA: hypothetical protein VK590_00725, partial [Saprospiraceae bacterium]|nr:hypothetical protein [Saprospiraceae bacterium]
MTEFNILSKSDWKQLVLKELKGQSFDSLKWTINDRINIDPYYTKEDAVSHLSILPVGNEWLIGESFDLTTPEESNNLLLESLSGGLQSPLFILADSFKQEELSIILKNVELSYLTPFWDLSKFTVASEIVSFLEVITEQSKQENNDLKGGLILNPIHLLEQFNTISIQFPALKIIAVHYVINEIQEVDSSLATMLLN